MRIAKLVCYIGSEPIWEFERKEGVYLVRNRGNNSNGKKHFVVQSPTGRLYTFYEYSGSEGDAINDIKELKAEGEDFFCSMDNIYEEI